MVIDKNYDILVDSVMEFFEYDCDVFFKSFNEIYVSVKDGLLLLERHHDLYGIWFATYVQDGKDARCSRAFPSIAIRKVLNELCC